MPDAPISFLVLSDIHTWDGDPSGSDAPSYVSTQASGAAGWVDPITDMIKVVKELALPIRFLVCPGDMTDKALPAGLTYIAGRLAEVQSKLEIDHAIVMPGNHDIDSRYGHNGYDPKGYFMKTFPDSPLGERVKHLEFFAEHLSIREYEDVRIVAVNSCAFHGGGRMTEKDKHPTIPEYEHGRVSPITISELDRRLQCTSREFSLNVLVCHHHPVNNNAIAEIDTSEMTGGSALIEMLERHSSRWLVIHGHKHRPRICYASSTTGVSPVILGAGSFSAQIGHDAQNRGPNQFHIVTFDPGLTDTLQAGIAGSVQSYSWIPGEGWKEPSGELGMPTLTGFGFRADPAALAARVAQRLGDALVEWSDLANEFPELRGMLPRARQSLVLELEKLDYTVMFSNRLEPTAVGKRR